VVSSCSPGRGADSIGIFRVPQALSALLLTGCQLGFPLDGYDDGSEKDSARCETAFLCEDFESGIDPARWENVVTTGSSVEIDDTRFHGGKRALHSSVTTSVAGAENKAQLNHDQTVPDRVFVRFFAWVQPASVDDVVVAVLMRGSGEYLGTNLRVTPLGLVTLTNWAEEPDANYDGATSVPSDRWLCFEWSVDRTTGKIEVKQDGKTSVSVTASTIVDANWLQLGALLTQPAPGDSTDVWIDDLIVDTRPIGCSN